MHIFFKRILNFNIEKKIVYGTVIFSLVVILIFVASFFDYGMFDITFYNINNKKITEQFRIVCVADLHLREFGENNEKLLKKIKDLKPDIIAVPGDLTTYKNKNFDVALDFLKNVKEIAPTYYSLGNHEHSEIILQNNEELRKSLYNTGVNVVNKSTVKANVNGNNIIIGGFISSKELFEEYALEYAKGFSKNKEFKLLLTHYPDLFEECMKDYPVDLALCGHAHGGQVRLPIVGGVFAPEQGLFPEFTEGMHTLNGSTMIITRGLGNSSCTIRFNNNPEIVVVDVNGF